MLAGKSKVEARSATVQRVVECDCAGVSRRARLLLCQKVRLSKLFGVYS